MMRHSVNRFQVTCPIRFMIDSFPRVAGIARAIFFLSFACQLGEWMWGDFWWVIQDGLSKVGKEDVATLGDFSQL